MNHKVRLVVILLLTVIKTMAQEYHPVVLDSNISFYLNPATSKIHAIKIDTGYLTQNGQVYELHKTWNEDMECVKPNGPSWLGSKFVVDTNNRFLFFNSSGDTVFFYPNTDINTEWLFYTYANSNYVIAKITKKTILSFLSTTDSIIEISFKEYSQDGILLPVASMQYPIQISKKYGFVSMYNWNEMEYPNKPFTLFGMTKYNLGQTFLTKRKLYDFNVGDEFHYETVNIIPLLPNNYRANTIKRVISKYISNNTDTIIYTFSRKEFIDYFNNGKEDTLINDTLKETILLREDKLYVPNEPILYGNSIGQYWGSELKWSVNDQRLRFNINSTYYYTSDSICWRQAHGDPGETRTYMIGLGLIETQSNLPLSNDYTKLVYVNKKDGTLWGTPVKVGLMNQESINIFNIIPNPIHNGELLKVNINKIGKYNLQIINILGQLEYTANFETFSGTINLDHLNAGIYFVNITDNNNVIYTKKMLKE